MSFTSYATFFKDPIEEFIKKHPVGPLDKLTNRIGDMTHTRGISKTKFDARKESRIVRGYSKDSLERCQQLIHALGVNLLSQQDVGYLLMTEDDAFAAYILVNESVMEMIAASSE